MSHQADRKIETAVPGKTAEALSKLVSAATMISCNEPLAKRTTLRVGGPADLLVEPASEADLAQTVQFCQQQSLPFFILGRGSNLLVLDGGFRGVVIALTQPEFCRVEVDGHTLLCGAGAKLKVVANEARRQAITGLEFLEGIPGSVGGGLRMNAGAMGGALFDVVASVRTMDHTGQVRELPPSAMSVEYRRCGVLEKHIALGAVLCGRAGEQTQIQNKMQEFSRKRWSSQPAAPSAGCLFKNPTEIPAGKLIDELGLKGTRVGGARVALEHGNFIVNDGGATARDVCALMQLIQQRARAERGLALETEVEIVGSDV